MSPRSCLSLIGYLLLCSCTEDLTAHLDAAPILDGGLSDHRGEAPVLTLHREQVNQLVKPILDGEWTMGLVVGLISAAGQREVYGFGKTSASGGLPEGDTLFEIGSISKTFTSLLLAQMTQDYVSLNQPVQELLPAAKVTLPRKAGVAITLKHLATHVSGFPRMPDNFSPADPQNPYVDYGRDQLYAFINGYTLTREPGIGWLYSNVAAGLLGHALSVKLGSEYGLLLKSSITDPLKMWDTSINLSATQQTRLATGHDDQLDPKKAWTFDVLAPAGALRSTADDMLTYLAAQATISKTALRAAMDLTQQVHYDHKDLSFSMGLGWIINEGRYRWHNGGTGGFGSFAGFDPQSRTAVVVLANTITAQAPETLLGHQLLKLMAGESYASIKLPPSLKLPAATLDRYVGSYALGTQLTVTIARQGDYLTYQEQSSSRAHRMHAEADTSFYLRSTALQLVFVKGAQETYDTLVLKQGNKSYTLKR